MNNIDSLLNSVVSEVSNRVIHFFEEQVKGPMAAEETVVIRDESLKKKIIDELCGNVDENNRLFRFPIMKKKEIFPWADRPYQNVIRAGDLAGIWELNITPELTEVEWLKYLTGVQFIVLKVNGGLAGQALSAVPKNAVDYIELLRDMDVADLKEFKRLETLSTISPSFAFSGGDYPELRSITAVATEIKSIRGLKSLRNLNYFLYESEDYLEENQNLDLCEFPDGVETFMVTGAKVLNIQQIEHWKGIHHLFLENVPIRKEELSYLGSEYVYLSANGLTEICNLSGKCQQLKLDDNYVTDIDALRDHPQLQELALVFTERVNPDWEREFFTRELDKLKKLYRLKKLQVHIIQERNRDLMEMLDRQLRQALPNTEILFRTTEF